MYQQVKMIRHQTVPEHIHEKPSAGVDDGLDEGVEVAGLMEDGLAAVAAVEHVILHAANRSSGSSWHATIVKYHPPTLNIKICPLLSYPLSSRLYFRLSTLVRIGAAIIHPGNLHHELTEKRLAASCLSLCSKHER
jgi:hypothetical protein